MDTPNLTSLAFWQNLWPRVLMVLIIGLLCLCFCELYLERRLCCTGWSFSEPCSEIWQWPNIDLPGLGSCLQECDQKEHISSLHPRRLLNTRCKFMNNFHNPDSTTWWFGICAAVSSRTECLKYLHVEMCKLCFLRSSGIIIVFCEVAKWDVLVPSFGWPFQWTARSSLSVICTSSGQSLSKNFSLIGILIHQITSKKKAGLRGDRERWNKMRDLVQKSHRFEQASVYRLRDQNEQRKDINCVQVYSAGINRVTKLFCDK